MCILGVLCLYSDMFIVLVRRKEKLPAFFIPFRVVHVRMQCPRQYFWLKLLCIAEIHPLSACHTTVSPQWF